MRLWLALACAGLLAPTVRAAELPSFLRAGDAFCTTEADFDEFAAQGHGRAGSATETCQTVDRPTRVAVMRGQGGAKSMVLVMSGPNAYAVGWTNAALPVPAPSRNLAAPGP